MGGSWHAAHFYNLNLTFISYSFWNIRRKSIKILQIWWKKGNNFKMGNQIYFKIAGYVDLAVLIIFTQCQIFDIINGFWVIAQNLQCSIFSNSGHVGWCTASPDTILKLETIVINQTKFGFHWSSTFRGEDFWKSLWRTMDDGRRWRTPSDGNSSGQVS